MSNERETYIQEVSLTGYGPMDDPPQGQGWVAMPPVVFGHDHDGPSLHILWVREPQPDAWQDACREVGAPPLGYEPTPPGTEPMGTWKPMNGGISKDGRLAAFWRRPLRRVGGTQ